MLTGLRLHQVLVTVSVGTLTQGPVSTMRPTCVLKVRDAPEMLDIDARSVMAQVVNCFVVGNLTVVMNPHDPVRQLVSTFCEYLRVPMTTDSMTGQDTAIGAGGRSSEELLHRLSLAGPGFRQRGGRFLRQVERRHRGPEATSKLARPTELSVPMPAGSCSEWWSWALE